MFKYTKRLISDIRFWCREMKIRRTENAEWEQTEEEDWYSYRSGHGYYKTILHNRAERKRRHEQEKRAIQ